MKYIIAMCLLPYLKISPLNSNTQPHAMLALITAISLPIALTGKINLYPLTAVSSLFFLTFGIASGEIVQGISLAMLPIGIDFISRQDEEDIIFGAKIAIIVLLLGISLNIVAEDILSKFVSNFRSGGYRGMNSFASEASFLGLLGLACGFIFHTLDARKHWFWMSGLVTAFSGSATAIFPFVLMVLLIYIKGKKLLFYPIIIFIILIGFQYSAQTNTRFGGISRTILESPKLIFLDVSFSNRIVRSAGPIVEAYESGFYPQGFTADFEVSLAGLSDRADSTVGRLSNPASALIYGLGFLSFPFIVIYIINSRGPAEVWFILIYFSVVNISTATPYLWIIYAIPWILLRRQQYSKARLFE